MRDWRTWSSFINTRQNILHSQFKALCWCKWRSTLPPYGEAARTGSLCLGMGSRGQKWSRESSTLRGCQGSRRRMGSIFSQGDSAHPGTATGSHTSALVPGTSPVSVAVTQNRRQRGSDCSGHSAALGKCLCQLCLKLTLIMLALIKLRLRGLGCFEHC